MTPSGSTSYSIRGHSVVFHEGPHEYYVDGVKVPSVTEILRKYSRLHGLDDYSDIPQDVLRRAAARGTALHHEIEQFEKKGVRGSSEEFWNYLSLKSRHGVKVESSELPVLIFDDSGKPVCAGRLDLIATINGETALGDIKRTSRLYPWKVSLQLNLYRIGYIQSYGKACDRLFVMRLRKGVSEFTEFSVDENGALAVLRECGCSYAENQECSRLARSISDVAGQVHGGRAGLQASTGLWNESGNAHSRPAAGNVSTGRPDRGSTGAFGSHPPIKPDTPYYSDEHYGLLSLKGWYTFNGRIGRPEFLIRSAILDLLILVVVIMFQSDKLQHSTDPFGGFVCYMALFSIPCHFSVVARRTHDFNKSLEGGSLTVCTLFGNVWWVCFWISIILNGIDDPWVGIPAGNKGIVLLILEASLMFSGFPIWCWLAFTKGTDCKNRFGPDPTQNN